MNRMVEPPPLSLANWLTPAFLRQALRGDHTLAPTARLRRSDELPTPLPTGLASDLHDLPITAGGQTLPLSSWLTRANVDAFLVLWHGRVAYSVYLDGMTPGVRHQWASMTKAFNGLLASCLARKGQIDLASPVERYVPELRSTAFGTATLQQNLDMEVSFHWPADLSEMDWMAAVGLLSPTALSGVGIRQFLQRHSPPASEPHGSRFRYNNLATEVTAWAISNATHRAWPELVQEHLWQPLRTDDDATVILDPFGIPQASGGMASTAPDLARLGEMLRHALTAVAPANAAPQDDNVSHSETESQGESASRPVGERSAPADLRAAAAEALRPFDNRQRFAAGNITSGRDGFSYRNGFFHVNDGTGSVQMSGRFGQRVHIDPSAGMTIVQMAAFPGNGDPVAGSFLAVAQSIVRRLAGDSPSQKRPSSPI